LASVAALSALTCASYSTLLRASFSFLSAAAALGSTAALSRYLLVDISMLSLALYLGADLDLQ